MEIFDGIDLGFRGCIMISDMNIASIKCKEESNSKRDELSKVSHDIIRSLQQKPEIDSSSNESDLQVMKTKWVVKFTTISWNSRILQNE